MSGFVRWIGGRSGSKKPAGLAGALRAELADFLHVGYLSTFYRGSPPPPATTWGEVTEEMRLVSSFAWSLTDTITWCSHTLAPDDAKHSLRTIEPVFRPLCNRDDQVDSVVSQRAKRLKDGGHSPEHPVTDLRGGRLLAFEPDITLSDGAANAMSRGFFDDDNVPPPDTWVCYVYDDYTLPPDRPGARQLSVAEMVNRMGYGYLVAWVPPAFIPLADGGISVIPEQCVQWLDTLDTPFTQLLRKHGFLAGAVVGG